MSALRSLVGTATRCFTSMYAGVAAQPCQLLQRFLPVESQQVRGLMRHFFPRPSEHRRIHRHGLKKRLSTPGGKRVLFRRILKGRHVLAH
uniref:Large ribosomal subunit protein bL34m n=1 Tax=Ixodes scapularis TaxID=6945 RepID=A0A4D5RBE1_IXOSC